MILYPVLKIDTELLGKMRNKLGLSCAKLSISWRLVYLGLAVTADCLPGRVQWLDKFEKRFDSVQLAEA